MPNIYLVRHGQDEDNANGILNGHRDTPLTQLGVEQSQALAQNIKERNLDIQKMYSSPLIRAYRTGEIVADVLDIAKPEKLDSLIERNFGTMSGKKMEDIEPLCSPEIIKANPITYFLSPEGGETFPQLIERARLVLDFIEKITAYKNILLVTHGDTGKMIYAEYYHFDWREVLVEFHFGNCEMLLLSKDSRAEERHVFRAEQYNH